MNSCRTLSTLAHSIQRVSIDKKKFIFVYADRSKMRSLQEGGGSHSRVFRNPPSASNVIIAICVTRTSWQPEARIFATRQAPGFLTRMSSSSYTTSRLRYLTRHWYVLRDMFTLPRMESIESVTLAHPANVLHLLRAPNDGI